MMGVYGRRCLRSGCKGRVAFKVTQNPPTHSGTITDRNISIPTLSYTTSCYTSSLSLTAIKSSVPSKIPNHIVCTIPFLCALRFLTLVALAHVSNVITRNAPLLRNLRECVEKHLNNCGRRWVDLTTIFSLIKV